MRRNGPSGTAIVSLVRIAVAANFDQQPVLLDREMQLERPGAAGGRREAVLVQQIGDRRGALVLDLRAAADDACARRA